MRQPDVKRLERSRSDRMVAGVCGGLARYFDLHPAFYRVGFVVLTLLGGTGILIYAAAALVIPDEGREDSIAADALRHRRERAWPLIGVLLVGIALVALISRATLWPEGDAAWIVVLVAGAAILWTQLDRVPQPAAGVDALPAQPGRRPLRLVRWLVATLVVLVVVALAGVVVAFSTLDVSLSDGVGDRVYRVGSPSAVARRYELGIGDLEIDLRNLEPARGKTTVRAHVGIGNLRVIVPAAATVRYRAEAKWGKVDVFGETFDGHNSRSRGVAAADETRVLVVDAKVGAGRVTLDRALP